MFNLDLQFTEKIKLGEIVSVKKSKTADLSTGPKCWLLNLDQVESNTGQILNYSYVDSQDIGTSTIAFDSDMVLYSKLRPNLNKVVLPDRSGYATSEFITITPDPLVLNRSYLALFLRSQHTVQLLCNSATGAKMPRVKSKDLMQLCIPCPSIDHQKRIVALFTKTNIVLNKLKNEIFLLDELIKARFVEMFGDPETNLFDFEVKSLGDIAFVTKLAGFEYTKYIHYKDSGDIIMVRGLNCKQTKLVLDNIYWIDKSTSDSLPRSQLHKGDIVMTYVGTVGDVALIDQDNKYHLAPNVAKISLLNKNDNNPIYWVNSFMILKEYIVRHASATTQSALSMEKIRNIKFPVPPTYLQNEFANFVQQVDKSKNELQSFQLFAIIFLQ